MIPMGLRYNILCKAEKTKRECEIYDTKIPDKPPLLRKQALIQIELRNLDNNGFLRNIILRKSKMKRTGKQKRIFKVIEILFGQLCKANSKRFPKEISIMELRENVAQCQECRSIYSNEGAIEDWAWPYLGVITHVGTP